MKTLCYLLIGGVIASGCRGSDPAPKPGGLAATLSVEAFHTIGPATRNWASMAFAESLATALARMPGLEVRVDSGGSRPAQFALRGDVSARDGRLVIATRLFRSGERGAVWTATFWRSDGPNPTFAREVAADVGEALFGNVARSAVTVNGGRP